jgi:hypothetical protein
MLDDRVEQRVAIVAPRLPKLGRRRYVLWASAPSSRLGDRGSASAADACPAFACEGIGMEKVETVSDTFRSSILSDHCGVEVTVTFRGTLRVPPAGPNDLTIGNLDWFASAGNNQVRFRNVSLSRVDVEDDGMVTVTMTGHRPVEVTGKMTINLESGEVVQETPHTDLDRLCQLLTA